MGRPKGKRQEKPRVPVAATPELRAEIDAHIPEQFIAEPHVPLAPTLTPIPTPATSTSNTSTSAPIKNRFNPDAPLFQLTRAQTKALEVLTSDATHIALGGGSRSGKTFILLRSVIIRALKAPTTRHGVFRYTFNSVKRTIVLDTLPRVMKLCFPGLSDNCRLDKAEMYLTLPNGSEVWFGGLDDKERTEKILGMEFSTLYFNECSQIPWGSVVMATTRLAQKSILRLKCYYDFNPPSKKHWTYVQFIKKQDPITKQPVPKPFSIGFYLINPLDNRENLSDEYMAILEALPPKAQKRFLFGQFADDDEGALWTDELLQQNRVMGNKDGLPEFLRVIVAVDPSGCKGPEDTRSDEIGIVVMALGTDSHAYVLEDLSGHYGPEEWGQIVTHAYHRHKADSVVGEINFGGDMVRAVLHAQDPDVPFRDVRASRGKVVRAEPVSTLYERQKVHHVGHFPVLEDQLCAITTSGYMGVRSPDRADALIWGLTELFPHMTRRAEATQRPPKVHTVARSASRFDRARH